MLQWTVAAHRLTVYSHNHHKTNTAEWCARMPNELAVKIQEVAKARGLTLKQVAEKTGVPYDRLRRWATKGLRAARGKESREQLEALQKWLSEEQPDWTTPRIVKAIKMVAGVLFESLWSEFPCALDDLKQAHPDNEQAAHYELLDNIGQCDTYEEFVRYAREIEDEMVRAKGPLGRFRVKKS